ncbi:MAG: MutS protein msh4, partial [Tremellales sp. Tagirdzhanova-0007]
TVRAELEGSQAELLRLLSKMLADAKLENIDEIIGKTLNDDFSLKRSSKGQIAKTARLYAVKADCNRLLDVARETYKENIEDILALEGHFIETHHIICWLEWNEAGYRFSAMRDDIEDPQSLPLIDIQFSKHKIVFSTDVLAKRNQRMIQSQQEVFRLSNEAVAELVAEAPVVIVDASSQVDFISAPKQYAADGPANFQLVHGPNMSGKSTYLHQIGLLTVQAMLGCFVPVDYASFKLHDALLSRLSNDDSMEKSLSTFGSEMATSAMIIAPQEGIGLSHAIAETLIKSRAFVFFATHFHDLSMTLGPQAGVVRLVLLKFRDTHVDFTLRTTVKIPIQPNLGKGSLTRFLRVRTDPNTTLGKGLEIAKLAAFPDDVMLHAQHIASKLSELEDKGRKSNIKNAIAARRKTLLELRGRLRQVVDASKLDNRALAIHIRRLQTECVANLRNALEVEQASIEAEDSKQ